MGCCYWDGLGTKINLQKAVEWYGKAADQGCAEAQYNLGIYYFNQGQNLQAYKFFEEAASQGEAYAQNMLNKYYKEQYKE